MERFDTADSTSSRGYALGKWGASWIVGLILGYLGVGSAPAMGKLIAQPDHLLAVAQTPRPIPPAELKANDFAGGGTTVSIESGPTFGVLNTLNTPDGPVFEYVSGTVGSPTRPFYGRDQFTYRLVNDNGTSPPTTVTVTVKPRWIPISGRWITDVGIGGSEMAKGETGEEESGVLSGGLGFYNSAESRFRLCEVVVGPKIANCEDLDVPVPYATPGLQPVVGDWDQDDDDEVGLYHAGTGKLTLFELQWAPCSQPGERCLGVVSEMLLGAPGDQPLVGNWNGFGDDMGVYEPSTGWVRLGPDADEQAGTWGFEYLLGTPGNEEMQAVAGQWKLNSPDTAAIYDAATGWLYVAADNTGNGYSSQHLATDAGPLSGGVVFDATDLNDRARLIAIFFEDRDETLLIDLTRDIIAQVLVRVPTDPDGGCCD